MSRDTGKLSPSCHQAVIKLSQLSCSRLGYASNGKNYIYNHLKFVLKYHKDEDKNTFRVVGFLIEAKSVDKSGLKINEDDTCEIDSNGPQEVSQTGSTNLHFTYEVEESERVMMCHVS